MEACASSNLVGCVFDSGVLACTMSQAERASVLPMMLMEVELVPASNQHCCRQEMQLAF